MIDNKAIGILFIIIAISMLALAVGLRLIEFGLTDHEIRLQKLEQTINDRLNILESQKGESIYGN